MSVVAEVSVPSTSFPLGKTLQAGTDIRFELERIVPIDGHVVPFFWVRGGDVDALVSAVRTDPHVASISVIDRLADASLLRTTWTLVPGLVQGFVESGVSVLEATGTTEEWLFRLRAPNHDAIASLRQYCLAQEIPLDLHRIATLADVGADRYGLTATQHETLLVAYRLGYFDDPRGTTLDELADRFDVSPSAVSRRIRRATAALVGDTLDGPETIGRSDSSGHLKTSSDEPVS